MRLLRSTILAAALTCAVVVSNVHAAGIENPAGGMNLQSADPANPTKTPKVKRKPASEAKPASEGKAKAPEKKSESLFLDGYRQAYALIYKQQNYAEALTILHTLGRDQHPDVANLMGFASRKLGRTDDARTWYETALAADPKHTRTWQYYGMWHLERGDRPKAELHLKTIAAICGTQCEDYTSLKLALAGDSLVY